MDECIGIEIFLSAFELRTAERGHTHLIYVRNKSVCTTINCRKDSIPRIAKHRSNIELRVRFVEILRQTVRWFPPSPYLSLRACGTMRVD